MSQHLPIGGYEWLSESEIEQNFNPNDLENAKTNILNLRDDSDTGYIFEADLHYPPELHDAHNDYPFCAEKRTIPGIAKNEKLFLTFFDKEKYVIHYGMLKLALAHGLILKKIHNVLRFKQSAWLKAYIDMNTRYRAQATNEFDKSFYKLLNNAIYGKTMENVRLRALIYMITKWEGRGKTSGRHLIAQPNFKNCKMLDENLATIEMHKSHILMDKPIIVGLCVLELSKVVMYKFLYDYLKPKYGSKVRVVYTDTDSFILEIETEDVYADIRDDPDQFDTWVYPEGNIYGIPRHNNKVPGKFSDECPESIPSEVVCLRAKAYSVRAGRIEKMKKAKGVKRNVLKNTITFDDYYHCVINNGITVRRQYTIRSKAHNVYTISTKKIALNPYDDKRYILKPGNINTLAWGHYRLDGEAMQEEYAHVAAVAEKMRNFRK